MPALLPPFPITSCTFEQRIQRPKRHRSRAFLSDVQPETGRWPSAEKPKPGTRKYAYTTRKPKFGTRPARQAGRQAGGFRSSLWANCRGVVVERLVKDPAKEVVLYTDPIDAGRSEKGIDSAPCFLGPALPESLSRGSPAPSVYFSSFFPPIKAPPPKGRIG